MRILNIEKVNFAKNKFNENLQRIVTVQRHHEMESIF